MLAPAAIALGIVLIANGLHAIRTRQIPDGRSRVLAGAAAARWGWILVAVGTAWLVLWGFLLRGYWFG